MSVSFIDLSSDEEIEILTEKNVSRKNSITIPDVIIIDSDEVKEVRPDRPKETQLTSVKKVSTKPNSNAEKASKVVVENGDEVFIIDDDDDDDTTGVTVQPHKTTKQQAISAIKNKDLSEASKASINQLLEEALNAFNMKQKLEHETDQVLSNNKRNSTPTTSKPSTPPIPVSVASKSVNNKLQAIVVPLSSVFPSSSSSTPKRTLYCPSTKSEEVVILSDETEPKKESTRELRPRQKINNQKVPSPSVGTQHKSQSSTKTNISLRDNNGNSSGQSTSKTLVPKIDLLTKASIDNAAQERMNKYSIENMFDGLVKVSCKLFQDENLGTRLWRYFRTASEDVLKSEDFLNALKLALKSAEDHKNTTFEDKVIVSRSLKEVMRILKRQPERINKTLRKLNKMLQMLNERIRKLEEMEVTSSSDEEAENVYCLLDRHRTRAAKIYSKICELEGKAAHAGRATLQKFHFSGTSGYSKIEHALERYFNKTRLFPDFLDVKKLIEITVEKEKLQISPIQIHNIAQSVFLEFGNKLQRMRKCDDYTMLVDYLDDGTKDPALDDEDLFRKLEENKKNMKKEAEVLAQFVTKEVELKSKGEIKTDEEDAADSEGEESGKEGASEKKNLQFSDTEDELINEDVDSDRKRKLSPNREGLSLPPHKKLTIDLDQMEVNLKMVTDVEESKINTRRRSSAEKDIIMDQLGLSSKGKQRRI
ncbi:daxx-like protein isoform X2 [Halyomorpha halys]|uniref:daxx-like protein isoform X2 n=1 Tax=Halyomorpha halys TaxID=286706 RepID=UPI000D0C8564|nr:uncharacterized protein LOC106687122 isoform X2 [Halyomorpha halys]